MNDALSVRNYSLPRALSGERKMSFWRFSLDDPRLSLSRHLVFNLTRPEQSLLLLAPLAGAAGGFDLCRAGPDQPGGVLSGARDPDYQKLLAMVRAGKHALEAMRRFDMPGFQPPPPYLREMRHYGVLPANFPDDSPFNPYAMDRRYWRSLWYRPPATP